MRRHLGRGLLGWRLLVVATLSAILPCCSDRRNIQRGEELFQENCAICHAVSNLDLKKQPPKLDGLFQSKTLPSGAPATDEQVRRTIINGIGTMPAFDQRLSSADVNDLLGYLHELK